LVDCTHSPHWRLFSFSSRQWIIFQALVKAGRVEEQYDKYVLVEDVQKGSDLHRETDKGGGSQRVLDMNEVVLQAQSKWKGSGRFVLRKSCSVSIDYWSYRELPPWTFKHALKATHFFKLTFN
jgi:hypothetical protein